MKSSVKHVAFLIRLTVMLHPALCLLLHFSRHFALPVQMIIEAPEQQAALGADAIRSLMGRMTNTPPGRIFVYQTRTINNPNGEPFTSVRPARQLGWLSRARAGSGLHLIRLSMSLHNGSI